MSEIPQPRDYANVPLDVARERDLLRWLREQPESSRLAFVLELLNCDVLAGLRIAHKSLEDRASFKRLLEMAIHGADASTMKYWLESILPRLGCRRTARIIRDLAKEHRDGVRKALYWLPKYAATDEQRSQIREIEEELQ